MVSKIDKKQEEDITTLETRLKYLESRVQKLETFARTSDISVLE